MTHALLRRVADDAAQPADEPRPRTYRLLFDDAPTEDVAAADATAAIAGRRAHDLPHTVIDLTPALEWAERLTGPRAPRRSLFGTASAEPAPERDDLPVWMQRLAERPSRRGPSGGRS